MSGSTTCRWPTACRAAFPASSIRPSSVAAAARAAGVRLGLGGIGRAGQEDLPIPASLVYAQHARLGSGAALLSRSFLLGCTDLGDEVRRARAMLAAWQVAEREQQDLAAARLRQLTLSGAW